MSHKAGFVNIIGNPNVGKSTLMNALVGEKLSIITSKAQTTRHRIMGIVNGEDFQIVYSDTPGIIDPAYELQKGMMNFVDSALSDADILLYVTDIYEKTIKNESLANKIEKAGVPMIIVLNKIDIADEERLASREKELLESFTTAKLIKVSALQKINTDELINLIKSELPSSPPYFPKDELTDKTMRFFVSEIIREKIFLHYKKEVPYSTEVEIEEYLEAEDIIHIRAIIYVIRDSQKGILIGHKGAGLKKVGTEARLDMEEFIGKKVFLQLYVKVNKDWKNNKRQLKRFGYLN